MATKGQAILLVYTDLIDQKYDEDFNAWYDQEHLPQLLGLPGFLDAARYVAIKGGPHYLAAYELESVEALQTPEYKNRSHSEWENRVSPRVIGKNFARLVGEQIFPGGVEQPDRGMAPVLQIGRMSIPEDIDQEWNDWYNEEYIPGYRKVPGVLYARRYRIVDGDVRYATVYEFENEGVPDSAEWNYQRENSSPKSGPMRDAMTMASGSPGVYRRLASSAEGSSPPIS
jgi:hypothetical protein